MLCLSLVTCSQKALTSRKRKQLELFARLGGALLGEADRPKIVTKDNIVQVLQGIQRQVARYLKHATRSWQHVALYNGNTRLTPFDFAYQDKLSDEQVGLAIHTLTQASKLSAMYDEDDTAVLKVAETCTNDCYGETRPPKLVLRVQEGVDLVPHLACWMNHKGTSNLQVQAIGRFFNIDLGFLQHVKNKSTLGLYNVLPTDWNVGLGFNEVNIFIPPKTSPCKLVLPSLFGKGCKLKILTVVCKEIVLPQELSSTRLEGLALCGRVENVDVVFDIKSLKQLNLQKTQIGGRIPNKLTKLTNLVSLRLIDNDFEGATPVELLDLPNLKELYISEANTAFDARLDERFSNTHIKELTVRQ